MSRLTVQQWLNNPSSPTFSPPFDSEGDIFVGLVRFNELTKTFEITTSAETTPYEIAAERILTKVAFTDWIWQLHHKDWITGQHLKDFLDCLSCYLYREYGQFPQVFYEVAGGGPEGLDAV